MRERFDLLNGWSVNIITAFQDFERVYGKRAVQRRKLSNGGMTCCLYRYAERTNECSGKEPQKE